MPELKISRRNYLGALGAGAGAAAALSTLSCTQPQPTKEAKKAEEIPPPPEHERRMQWWREAKFGMFIHWGLYSVIGRHEWAMETEAIPVTEYELLAKQFKPRPNAAREWAKLAKRAGMKYMVMTSKHHEGFCHFDSKLTNYCAPRQGPGRDLAKEFVEAARAEGLRLGFYYSLMDWHHPDGAKCAENEESRRRFVDYIHGQIQEILTLYGKIDIMWYDVAWPLDAKGWESEKMNEMVLKLQPDIVINNRNQLPGDFGTPEQRIVAEKRDWEACMTMNDSWGYHKNDDDWKTPKTVIRNLVTCARGGGNYLLNIGPKADGSIPEESTKILNTVGAWMEKNSQSIYGAERCQVRTSMYAGYTRRGNTLYMHIHFWPGATAVIPGLETKVKSAKLLASGKPVEFKQEELRVVLTGLPESAPDTPVTTLAIECESEPIQNMERVRKQRQRLQA